MSEDFKIDGQALSPGVINRVPGTRISYAAAGTDAAIVTSTEAVGIGRLVVSAFGGGLANTYGGGWGYWWCCGGEEMIALGILFHEDIIVGVCDGISKNIV